MRAPRFTLLILTAIFVGPGCSTGTGTLQFLDFRASIIPGSPAAVYGKIVNHTDEELHLDGITSADFDSVTIHETIESEGHMRMEPAGEITIRRGSALAFEPGGKHIMLNGAHGKPAPGAFIHLTLTLNHRAYELDVPVREKSP